MGLCSSQSDQLSIFRWLDGTLCRVLHSLESSSSSVDLAPTQAKLGSLQVGCAGQVAARGCLS